MPASYAGEWALFRDYCAATDQPALPTTPAVVAAFVAAVPACPATAARRRRAVAAAHRRAGWGTGHLEPDPTPRPRGEAGARIAGCPIRGWPAGFTGRRDAMLVVLVEVLGHTQRLASRLTPDQISRDQIRSAGDGLAIAGVAVPDDEDPRRCPACAVVRWLEVCDLAGGPLAEGLGHAWPAPP